MKRKESVKEERIVQEKGWGERMARGGRGKRGDYNTVLVQESMSMSMSKSMRIKFHL